MATEELEFERELRVSMGSTTEKPVSYEPLWSSLDERNMKRTQLAKSIGISKSTLAKMGHEEYVSMEVICRICKFLECRVQDVVEIKYG